MTAGLSKYVSRPFSLEAKEVDAKARRTRVPVARRRKFVKVHAEDIAAFERLFGPEVALLLGLMQLSGTRWVSQRDGWVVFNQAMLQELGLIDRRARHRAMTRLRAADVIEIRGTPGSRLQYRLNPNWARPKAAVIDLATHRKGGR